jgi:hypothetical protein
MRVFINRVLKAAFPSFRQRKGAILNRLYGFNIATAGGVVSVEPIYNPLVLFEREGGIIRVTFSLGQPLATLLLFGVFPFINLVRFKELTLNLEDK